MRFIFASVVLVLTACACPALAADDCDNAEDQATLNECAGQEFAKADKALNATFKEIQARLADDPDGKTRLTTAQRAWITFRDAECDFQSRGSDGGSVAPMVYAACKATVTNTRTEELKAYLACEEGDLSCPVPGAQ